MISLPEIRFADLSGLRIGKSYNISISCLPTFSGVYFCLDGNGKVLYIGQSKNIQQRWRKHDQKASIKELHATRIAWIQVPVKDLLETEAAFIEKYRPVLNSAIKSVPGRVSAGFYGETKKQKQFLLTPSASEMLDEMVTQYDTTRSDFLEKVIRGIRAMNKESRDRLMKEVGVVEEGDQNEAEYRNDGI